MTRSFRLCGGRLIAGDVAVAVHPRVLKIALVSAGVNTEPAEFCQPIDEPLARRVLSMERALMLSSLEDELRAA
jgi:hypothetical protein